MVRLRLRRVGRKKQPSFRIIAADKESPRDGRFLEVVGFYNPRTEPETITLKEERIYDWLSKGAQPSDAVERIFRTSGLSERFERFKAGEDVKKLVEESEAWQAAQNVTTKTRTETPASSKKKAKKAKEAPTEASKPAEAEKPAEEAPAAKPAAEAEAPAEEAPAAEEPAEEAPAEEFAAEAEAPAEEAPAAEEPAQEAPAEEPEEKAEE
jgi:small subunit ribosomal protein S16